ncbi:MAG TPA: Holliday junction resolvase-like protein [Geobacterales bacterium]|nr:Holliday junction resolvase-like protein [Geobacterales bacterium]
MLEILIGIIVSFFAGIVIGYILLREIVKREFSVELKERIEQEKEKIKKETLERSRSTLKGKISEQLAPLLPGFEYNASDARFIGTPIDYIIFDGYSNLEGGDKINIIFLEVKSGKSRTNKAEEAVRDAVLNKRVEYKVLKLEY